MTQTNIASRRAFLFGTAGAALAIAACGADPVAAADRFAGSSYRKLSDADWRARLPGQSYGILRHENTETPGTSPLLNEHRKGTFVCLGCGLPMFSSAWKFESGTGWPSFWTVYKSNIRTKVDNGLLEMRTEYHCAQCLGHQGHVFNDGPKPTGLRYCNNGASLRFIPG